MDSGGSVTLVFYRIPAAWYREPLLNIVAAAFQNSSFTHVELAIGSAPGDGGQMTNVARVFNDSVGACGTVPNVTALRAAQANLCTLVRARRRRVSEQNGTQSTGAAIALALI